MDDRPRLLNETLETPEWHTFRAKVLERASIEVRRRDSHVRGRKPLERAGVVAALGLIAVMGAIALWERPPRADVPTAAGTVPFVRSGEHRIEVVRTGSVALAIDRVRSLPLGDAIPRLTDEALLTALADCGPALVKRAGGRKELILMRSDCGL